MRRRIGQILLFFSLLLLSPIGALADEIPPSMAVPVSPHLPPVEKTHTGKKTQKWSFSPTYTFYMLPGGGLSRYLDQAFGVGGEISRRLGDLPERGEKATWLSHLRWLGDFSYFQMTPGPTLAPSLSSSTSIGFSNVSPQPLPPIPGSASITGFILRTGLACDIPEVTPARWGLRRVIVPYIRIDVGGVDWAVSNIPGLSGHPYGGLLDVGAGISLSIPGYPLGVFGEADPTAIDAGGNVMTILPLVAGVSFRF